MKLSKSVKPISYLKAHASEIIRGMSDDKESIIITLNGEAKAVLQDITAYEQTQESLALLKILAQSNQSLKKKKTKSLKTTFRDVRRKIKTLKKP